MLYLLFTPFTLFVVYRLYRLANNYIEARKYGIPIIFLPVSFEDAWWVPLRPLFSWVERLPFGLGGWYVYTSMGWPTEDTDRTVKRLGENFVLCSPTHNCIASCYPPTVNQVFRDHKNWPQPGAQSQLFAFYGQNVSSTNGADWQRHRKITASAFNEHSMHEVWQETVQRVREAGLGAESDRSLACVRTTFDVLAMQVLAAVGFGQHMPLTTIPPGHRESLMESLGFILQHIMLTLVFNGLKAPDWMLPNILKRLKVSVTEFKMYMQESIVRHMQASKTKTSQARTSLLEAMVKANEAEKQQTHKATGRPSYLTDSELYGNLFVFNLAGYETTASSMTFALPFLALHPHVQDWVIEEVDKYYNKDTAGSEYADTYPKLVRCLSVMYETLRLASPAPMLVRTPPSPTKLPISTLNGQRTVTVNPGTLIGGHFYGAHLSPRWGHDASAFNPIRFVSRSSSSDEEEIVVPDGALYCPWIFGPRVCPGKKFSQVEFVAAVAQILSQYRIRVLREENESEEGARARMMKVLDGKFFNISTHLRTPEAAGVRFVKRT